jgi:hypothetical protein
MKYQTEGNGFKIPFKTGGGFTHVPNKQAAGMLKTRQRTPEIKDSPKIDAIRLAHYGTLDKLANPYVRRSSFQFVGVCKCCGHDIRKLRLHPSKRSRLNNLRLKYHKD